MDFEDIIIKGGITIIGLFIIGVILAIGWPYFLGNKGVDFVATFNYADVFLGNEVRTYEIKKWTDYEGEQLQIWTKDGNVILVSSFNTILRQK